MWRFILCFFGCWVMIIGPVVAQTTTYAYNLSMRGLKVGELSMSAATNGSRYDVSGQIQNTGLTAVMRKFSYNGSVSGALKRLRLSPSRYKETADTGKRRSKVKIAYSNGVPAVVRYDSDVPLPPNSPDPRTQSGTFDPLTAIFALLRDVPAKAACDIRVVIFDGRRRSSITAQKAGTKNGLPKCVGRYERLQGFTPEETARHKHFDFTMSYVKTPDGLLRVDRVAFDSVYGQAVIDRR